MNKKRILLLFIFLNISKVYSQTNSLGISYILGFNHFKDKANNSFVINNLYSRTNGIKLEMNQTFKSNLGFNVAAFFAFNEDAFGIKSEFISYKQFSNSFNNWGVVVGCSYHYQLGRKFILIPQLNLINNFKILNSGTISSSVNGVSDSTSGYVTLPEKDTLYFDYTTKGYINPYYIQLAPSAKIEYFLGKKITVLLSICYNMGFVKIIQSDGYTYKSNHSQTEKIDLYTKGNGFGFSLGFNYILKRKE